MKKLIPMLAIVAITAGSALAQLSVTINSDTICSGSSATLLATISGGAPPYMNTWTGGYTGNPITVSPTVTTSYTCTVVDNNGTNAMGIGTVHVVNGNPAQPSSITGNFSPCQGSTQTYCVTSVPYVNYTWQIPNQWILVSGQGSNCATYVIGANAFQVMLVVGPSNVCGSGVSKNTTVTVTLLPSLPSTISGPVSPCEGSVQTYSVQNVTNVSFNWTFPSGWTINAGGGTSTVTVTVGATAGTISVNESNGCGNGPSRNLSVAPIAVPAQPDSITGPLNPSPGSSVMYCVTNVPGTVYTWTVPFGWTITAGQGTYCVNVNVGTTIGCITVTPTNACGNGPSQSLCFGTNDIAEQDITEAVSLNIIPNPAGERIEISCCTESPGTVQLMVYDLSGQLIYADKPANVNGSYSKILDISVYPEGIYAVMLRIAEGTLVRRMVVMR